MASFKYEANLFEFFGKESWWNEEYEVVQKGSRDWTGTVMIKWRGESSYDLPFYGYQTNDAMGQGKDYGKFAIGDTLTLKSCLDSLEQGINYSVYRKDCSTIECNRKVVKIALTF